MTSSHSPVRFTLALGALGVVFGDIGTSPLYTLRACVMAAGNQYDPLIVHGVLSLIFWALALTISAKYLLIVLRNDNDGEGGVLALTALVSEERLMQRPEIVGMLGLAGCALFYGDGVITPAVTVLGAVEGIETVEPGMKNAVIPLAIGILYVLFRLQRRGTGALGTLFGPVMLVWFATLAVLGIKGIVAHPAVLEAVNPYYALRFLGSYTGPSLLVIGGVFLAVTGGEALYADLGHFGLKPIRAAWFIIAWPALVANYFGQGALLLENPAAIVNPFFHLAPTWFTPMLLLLATAAAIIASQAVISGVFSMTQQARHLGFLPNITVVQSSAAAVGQVYVPAVNWLMCLATIGLVIGFGSSQDLAEAYGIAVASTMVIETSLLFVLLAGRESRSSRVLLICLVPLALVDATFFIANASKIPQGGWFPLAAAAVMYGLMRTWTKGRIIVSEAMRREGRSDAKFLASLDDHPPAIVPGVAVFLTSDASAVPRTLIRNVKHNGVLHEHTILLTIVTARVPKIPLGSRMEITAVGRGIFRVCAHVGFMDRPNVPLVLRSAARRELPIRCEDATYFLGREDIVVGTRHEMVSWRKNVFRFLARNSQFVGDRFGIPPTRIIEIGGQVEI
jgi:KUP system potassium uptake protein